LFLFKFAFARCFVSSPPAKGEKGEVLFILILTFAFAKAIVKIRKKEEKVRIKYIVIQSTKKKKLLKFNHFGLFNKPRKAIAIIRTKITTPIDQTNILGDL
jgi:hypothetical protein